ncbi:hypothetical protein [Thiorhodococcus fuscus]|uniref:RRM domain-containing protein n=1 Tax=Thiorhodococcus fuscus TaxID=527200 RepID=A0ABW4YC13_9GAMM
MTAKHSTPDPKMVTICVTNLASETTAAEVTELFSAYGAVRCIQFSENRFQHRFQKIAHVDLSSAEPAQVLAGLDGQLFKGAIIELTQCSDASSADEDSADQLATVLKDSSEPNYSARTPYELISVEKVDMTASTDGVDWFRYILESGTSSIVGYRQGGIDEVTAFAQTCADDFNLRNTVGWKRASGRVRKQ